MSSGLFTTILNREPNRAFIPCFSSNLRIQYSNFGRECFPESLLSPAWCERNGSVESALPSGGWVALRFFDHSDPAEFLEFLQTFADFRQWVTVIRLVFD